MEVNLAQLIFTLSYKHDTVIAPSDSSRTNEEFSKGENESKHIKNVNC